MQTVFSHIVQTRLSQESENVATSALAFILESSEAARNGMMKLLKGVVPEMPPLWFRTQQMKGSSRPDMWGIDENANPHVFVENKFWAGLTDNQPVSYLEILAEQNHPTMLLVVVPDARKQTVWDELSQRLKKKDITATDLDSPSYIVHSVKIGAQQILALTSWTKLLDFLELETTEDKSAKSDLLQLRALCAAVDSDAFVPFSSELSDQRIPALSLQLFSIVKAVLEKAFSEKVLNSKGIGNQWIGAPHIGRYASLGNEKNVGLWLGIDFELWKRHGGTPLWCKFSASGWGRAHEVRELLEPWAAKNDVFTAGHGNSFVVALSMPVREEKDAVVSAVVARLKQIELVLSELKPRPTGDAEQKEMSTESSDIE